MLITENDIRDLIRRQLIEKKIPEKGKKMFDGDFYESKDGKVKGMTLMYEKGGVAYFLLPKDTKLNNANTFKTTPYPKQGETWHNWSAALDEYSDYSQVNFFKHIKAKRIVTGTDYQKQPDYAKTPVEEFFYNFGFDALNAFVALFELLPIPGVQQAATVFSKGISSASFVAAVRQQEYVTAVFAVAGMVPAIGGALGASMKLLDKYKSAKLLPGSVLRKCAEALLKFLDSDIHYSITLALDKLLKDTEHNSEDVFPKLQRAAKHYAKILNEEADKADKQSKV